MGAWGIGPFENDDAADWVYEVIETTNANVFAASLRNTSSKGYVEASEACCALAAAEIVAALLGRPSEDLPDEVREWVKSGPLQADEALVSLATAAASRVANDSELKELWDETDESEAWQTSVNDLIDRLKPT